MFGTDDSLIVRLLLGALFLGGLITTVVLRVKGDYEDYLSLGPGGTPSTFSGYLRIKILGLFAVRNPYEPPDGPEECHPRAGYLADLPKRPYPRPVAKGIAPQRQTTQRGTPAIYKKLMAAIEEMAAGSEGQLKLGTSCFEKHGTGLFAASTPEQRTCNGEICHVHPSDGSLHLTLHPADIRVVLSTGWGQRHPLARGGFFERFVPHGFMMIYAPQTEEEVHIIMQIIAAAAQFVCGSGGCKKSGV